MVTVIVRNDRHEIEKKLRRFGLGSLIGESRTRPVPNHPELLAIQHPKLATMGQDAIADLCSIAGINLAFCIDAPVIPVVQQVSQ